MQMRPGRLSRNTLLAAALLPAVFPAVLAAAAAAPDGAPSEAREMAQGLTLTFTSPGGDSKIADSRGARLVALYVPQGTAPSPFQEPGRFVATWTGAINMRLRDTYTFSAAGRGKLTVTVEDKV